MVGPQVIDERRWTLYGDLTPGDQQNLRRYGAWLLAWVALWLGVRIAMEGWPPATRAPLAWALIAIATVPGLFAIAAYVRFVRAADELLRKIQLEALALAFGAGALFMMAWRLVEKAGGPGLDVNDPLLVMFFAWVGGQWWFARRYR
jgi:hypothetical protein